MSRNYTKIIINSLIISFVGVFIVDYFSHLLFSNPMETTGYFLGKMTLYFVLSVIFFLFSKLDKIRFIKVVIAGIIVALIWGTYYNILPSLFDFYPIGIALNGISFLDMGLWGTGLAFGIVHTFAFVVGYYVNILIMKILKY